MKKSDLKKIGTIVETRNKLRYAVAEKPDWADKQILCSLNKARLCKELSDWDDDLKSPTNRDFDIMRVQEPFSGIYWERPGEILDDKEKEYLAAVIKPFLKYKIKIIKKFRETEEYLSFKYFNEKQKIDGFYLPFFEAGTMYKGMKREKEYTPEELGLE